MVRPVAFEPRPLPGGTGTALAERLAVEHAVAPLSAGDVRETVRRVERVVAELGLSATVCRGGLDLCGAEADHVWVDVGGRVVDAAYPVRSPAFVAVLREWVEGRADDDALEDVAATLGVGDRVIGVFPRALRYVGAPVWSAR